MALVLVSELPDGGDRLPPAAALGVAAAQAGRAVLLAEVAGSRGRGPTMLASESARALEHRLRAGGFDCAARGRLAWLRLGDEDWRERLAAARELGAADCTVAVVGPARFAEALEDPGDARAALLRAALPAQRSLAALAVGEIRARGLAARVGGRGFGRVAARRALAGIEPGGEASRRASGWARAFGLAAGDGGRSRVEPRRLVADSGQALPLMLGAMLILILCTLALAAIGGAVTGKSRAQRAADLAAISGARQMRDEVERLFTPARGPDGTVNPLHLAKADYLEDAERAAVEAARRNGLDPSRVRIGFPDRGSFAPLRIRAVVQADLEAGGEAPIPVAAYAEAEAVPASTPAAGSPAGPATASGGGYSGPLEYRQGEGMRPDVAAAFDRMAAAAAADGVSLLVNDGFRSDAEQAELWAQNPDPQWVAPPGTSLHRCATELDLGPPSAYAWLAANADRFGFAQRYSWEAWHYGFTAGPEPCSAAGDAIGGGSSQPPSAADGDLGKVSLPAFVPARYRDAIAAAARRWNVSGALLAAQLMAESNFNPFAVSAAGAAGIAQFMPATAAAYGLDDPFDAAAAIDAQAHLMSDLLGQFGDPSLALAAYNAGPAPVESCGCVPAYPETQTYVARILALMGGAGVISPAPLEVRLVD